MQGNIYLLIKMQGMYVQVADVLFVGKDKKYP